MKRLLSGPAASTYIVASCVALLVSAPTASAGVLAFGTNSLGKTGMGASSGYTEVATPVVATNLVGRTVVQADTGRFHSLLLTHDGTVFSFGESDYGETGLGTTTGYASIATPVVTTNLGERPIKQVDAGHSVSLLLADDGSVFSFGNNTTGQLGQGTTDGTVAIPTPIVGTNLGGRKTMQMSAGLWHSLLLADDGSVFSMGTNGSGQTGLGTTRGNASIATPIDATNLAGRKITQVAAGDRFSLLLADDGSVFSFGANNAGQLGLGTPGDRSVAMPIDATNLGGRKITKISAGFEHSLLLADDGSVFAFGRNSSGQLGLGTSNVGEPVAKLVDTTVLGGSNVTAISAGHAHSLILSDDGRAFSFGMNLSRQLGLGSSIAFVTTPTPINATNLGGQFTTQLEAGGFFSLMLTQPALPGDFNLDRAVDAADYVVWCDSLGNTGSALAADGDQDHQIDADDYQVWKTNFGATLTSGSGSASVPLSPAVPEPASIWLLLLGPIVIAPRGIRLCAKIR